MNLQKKNSILPIKIEATFDGMPLAGFRVDVKEPFAIENIPRENSLGLSQEELLKSHNKVEMACAGHVYFLRPLSSGLHILHLLAYSRVYQFDATFQLNVRG